MESNNNNGIYKEYQGETMRITESRLRQIIREEITGGGNMNTATVDLETNAGTHTIKVNYTDVRDLVLQVMEAAAHMERRWASNYDEPSGSLRNWRIEPIITRSSNDADVDPAQRLLDTMWAQFNRVDDYGN